MLKVKDIMTPRVLTVSADDTTEAAADWLSRDGISGAPVRNAEGVIVGMVSLADLANRRLTTTTSGRQLAHPKVADVMTPDALSVSVDSPAVSAALVMSEHDIHRLLVLDDEGQPAGMVTALDVVKAVARGARFLEEGGEWP